jgi:hypothetical protein
MFPRFKRQLLAQVDLLVELSTLGEYGIDERGGVMPLEPTSRCPEAPRGPHPSRRRDICAEPADRSPTGLSRGARARL